MSPRRRVPAPIGEVMASVLGRLTPRGLLPEAQAAWRRAAGAGIAARAHPVSERDGVLTIACESAVWAQELALMEPQLLERLEAELGAGSVAGLRFVVADRED